MPILVGAAEEHGSGVEEPGFSPALGLMVNVELAKLVHGLVVSLDDGMRRLE